MIDLENIDQQTTTSDGINSNDINIQPSTNHSVQSVYKSSNGKKSILLAMYIGLYSGDEGDEIRKLADLTIEPFISSRVKRTFTLNKSDPTNKVKRRFVNVTDKVANEK